jgi:hypothetical protein
MDAYAKWKSALQGGGDVWRSGIKHDCAALMEFRREGSRYRNGAGELVDLEDELLFPLLKSSDIAHGKTKSPNRFLLVTQRRVGEDTGAIAKRAPRTWRYLQRHAVRFAARKSSIYRAASPFSIFGVGPYSFAPWKVAISGLYKSLNFAVAGGVDGKPVVLDDTCYFLPCKSHAEAQRIVRLLNSPAAVEALSSLIFWDAKRPVTAALLCRLSLAELQKLAPASK